MSGDCWGGGDNLSGDCTDDNLSGDCWGDDNLSGDCWGGGDNLSGYCTGDNLSGNCWGGDNLSGDCTGDNLSSNCWGGDNLSGGGSGTVGFGDCRYHNNIFSKVNSRMNLVACLLPEYSIVFQGYCTECRHRVVDNVIVCANNVDGGVFFLVC